MRRSRTLPMVIVGLVAGLVAACAPASPVPLSAPTTPAESQSGPSSPGAATGATVSESATTSGGPSASSVGAPATPAVAHEPACTSEDLSARQTYESQVMNQPFSEIAVVNTSRRACTLDGYPRIEAAWATEVSASGAASPSGAHRVTLRVLDSGNYEVIDPGPRSFSVPPGGAAWFALGTSDSEPPWERFSMLEVAPAGSTRTATGVQVRVTIVATSAPTVAMSVTAFAPGLPSHP